MEKLRANCAQANAKLEKKELEEVAKAAYREWDVNQREVQANFNQFINFYNVDGKSSDEVKADLCRILRVRFRNGAPRQPPKVVIIGPPGSGVSTQTELIAERFGLVAIQPEKLVNEEMKVNQAMKMRVDEFVKSGRGIPDDVLMKCVSERMKQSDCMVNGWVMDNFPKNGDQLQLLKVNKIVPSLLCEVTQSEETSCRRLENRRVDPITGQRFNLAVDQPSNEEQAKRLV